MTGHPREPLERWARARGLEFVAEDLLPPATSVLRKSLGVGEHRAARAIRQSGNTTVFTGGLKKWPERRTLNLCRGVLPGGLEGLLAHHAHLDTRPMPVGGGRRWVVLFDTVVFAQLPERNRAVFEFSSWPGRLGQLDGVPAVDLSGPPGPGDRVVTTKDQVEERAGRIWRINPAESAETLDILAEHTIAALAATPDDTGVQLVDGYLCVSATGPLEHPAQLDGLCAVAAALAEGVRAVAAGRAELDPASALPAPPDNERARWIDEGVQTVHWPQPPETVGEAVAAYEAVVAGRAARAGRLGCAVAVVVGFVVALIWVLGTVLLNFGGGTLVVGGALAVVAVVVIGFKTVRAAREMRREVAADLSASRARPWAMAAFARGYASSRGLALEDPEELRRRFRSPLPGRPVRAFHGDLGGGVPGHLALWTFRPPEGPLRHWLIAAVAAPDGPVSPPAGYFSERAGDALAVWTEIAEDERSATRLDALAKAAAGLVRA